MNKHLHRIVFNAARGMRMVVQETATSTGKGASGATGKSAPAAAAAVLFGLLVALPGQAQIVASPMVPGSLRPTVLVAPNGVPWSTSRRRPQRASAATSTASSM
jgi:filamentous hemagglutinin